MQIIFSSRFSSPASVTLEQRKAQRPNAFSSRGKISHKLIDIIISSTEETYRIKPSQLETYIKFLQAIVIFDPFFVVQNRSYPCPVLRLIQEVFPLVTYLSKDTSVRWWKEVEKILQEFVVFPQFGLGYFSGRRGWGMWPFLSKFRTLLVADFNALEIEAVTVAAVL